jgi:type I restriction enzyme S subunit
MVILRKKSDELIEEFFRYYLSSSSFSGQVRSRVSGSAQPQLPIRDMVSMKINLPNKEKQIKIASILSSYDDLIEKNEKRIKILEEVAQLLYHEWFVKFRFPGHESVKMVESNSKYGNIPEGWKLGRLGEIVDIIRTPAQAGEHLKGRQYVPIENISKKSFIIKESSSWMEAQSSLILFEKNDILFGAMRPYFHKVSVASNPGVTRTTCLVLRPKKEFLLSFSFLSVFSNDFVNFASSNTQGATIPYAVWENSLENYKILIPTNQYLMEFETINKRLVYQIRVLVEANNILSKTRDLLIPQLVTGKKLLLNL